jgi:hypothetical protein
MSRFFAQQSDGTYSPERIVLDWEYPRNQPLSYASNPSVDTVRGILTGVVLGVALYGLIALVLYVI